MTGPEEVMATVCSKWAERLPLFVTTVPSRLVRTALPSALIIGSMAMVMPGKSLSP